MRKVEWEVVSTVVREKMTQDEERGEGLVQFCCAFGGDCSLV